MKFIIYRKKETSLVGKPWFSHAWGQIYILELSNILKHEIHFWKNFFLILDVLSLNYGMLA